MNPACHNWKKMPPANKTWPAFKAFFVEAMEDLDDEATAQDAGHHAANCAVTEDDAKIADASANLAKATVANPETMTANNASLLTIQKELAEERKHNNNLQQQLIQLMGQLAAPSQQKNFQRQQGGGWWRKSHRTRWHTCQDQRQLLLDAWLPNCRPTC